MMWRHSLAQSSPHAVQSSCDSSLCRHAVGSVPQLLRGPLVSQWCKRRVQIVSRRRGFTVETCTAVVPAAKESPTFQGLSAGQRVPPFIFLLQTQSSCMPKVVPVSRFALCCYMSSCASTVGCLPAQVNAAGTRTCRGSQDAELRPACAASCRDACRDGLAVYTAESSALSGFKVRPKTTYRSK
jgi:hypothetical protein